MENITYRTNFLTDVEVDKIAQKDMGSMDFSDFDFGPVLYYRCTSFDIGRPDLISQKVYGTTNYWWFILWFNGVCDAWNDIREGMLLAYPSLTMAREGLRFALARQDSKT